MMEEGDEECVEILIINCAAFRPDIRRRLPAVE
jgi:hypothetical protein